MIKIDDRIIVSITRHSLGIFIMKPMTARKGWGSRSGVPGSQRVSVPRAAAARNWQFSAIMPCIMEISPAKITLI